VGRVEYWNGLPERDWERSGGAGLWDRREGIRKIAQMIGRPRVLEIGVDRAGVLSHCHDVFGAYTGVDIRIYDSVKELKDLACPFRFVECQSVDFWKSLTKADLYDLIYVDGDHGKLGSHLDITQGMLRLAPGGFILAHDISPKDSRKDTGPAWSYNRICNLPGWYARVLEGHGEGMAIFFKED
jgi:hypothetical protein